MNIYRKREEENKEDMSLKTDIGWGHQIRSYVLQPYQLVKDLRNNLENDAIQFIAMYMITRLTTFVFGSSGIKL